MKTHTIPIPHWLPEADANQAITSAYFWRKQYNKKAVRVVAFENEFLRDKVKGKCGEQIVFDYYCGLGCNIIDVSEDKEYQQQDIDFLIDGIGYEVKTQTCVQESKICIELTANVERNYNGWFYTTAAQYLVFVDKVNGILYKIRTEDLREYYYKNKQTITTRQQHNAYKTSVIAFIPIEDLEEITERIEIV